MNGQGKSFLRRCLLVSCAMGFTAVVAVVAFVIGGIWGQLSLYHRDAAHQTREITELLERETPRYSEISIREESDGWVSVNGTVKLQADLDELRAELKRMYGENLGDMMIGEIIVEE